MTEFKAPTRDQLAMVARGDQRLLRAFEQLFRVVGGEVGDGVAELTVRVDANEVNIKSNEVLLWLSM